MSQSDIVRICVLGSGGVGKTCVILRFLRDTFDPDYIPTIQDNFEKVVTHEGKPYRLHIIDTAGQDEMESITNLAVKSADAFIIIYSCTSSLSFTELERFRDKIYQLAVTENGQAPLIVFAGNKCDLEDDRAVTLQQGKQLGELMSSPFFECSAKSNHNINILFEKSLKQFLGVHNEVVRPERVHCCCVA
jgi:small GTP-binding protein